MERRSRRIFGTRETEPEAPRQQAPTAAPERVPGPAPAEPAAPAPEPPASAGPTVDELQARRVEIARMEERALHEQEAQRLKRAELD